MSPRAIETLRHEHRLMSRRLDILEGQLDLLELNLEADCGLLLRITDYFRSYPYLYHHPKEELLLRTLVEIAPDAASELFGMTSEHRQSTQELVGLSHALTTMLMESGGARARFHACAMAFIASARRHMRWEEKRFFVIAAQHLSAADWIRIEAKFARFQTPAQGCVAPIKFHRLTPGLHAAPDLAAA